MGQVATLSIGANTYSVYAITTDAIGDANSYFAAHIAGSPWTDADSPTRKKALISAFRIFETLSWEGEKTVPGQATQFPRTGLDCDGESLSGTPDRLVHGEFELALLLLSDTDILGNKSTRSDVKRVQAGTASVEFFIAPPGEETRLPTAVHNLVACFLSSEGIDIGKALASGVDVGSFFEEDSFERNDGFA